MKVKGAGAIRFFENKDECPQVPGDDPYWQDSFVLNLWDTENGVYALLRVSQVPNRDGGLATTWLNIWTPDYLYKNTQVKLPLRPGDRQPNALSVGGGLCRYHFDGRHNWSVKDEENGVSAELTLTDAHPGMCFYPQADDHFLRETTANHIEASGEVTGKVSVQGRAFNVQGPGWRDHSWGRRVWSGIRAHRFFSASFGDALRIACLSYIGDDGQWIKNGTIISDGEVQYTNDFTVTAFMGEDATGNRGGDVILNHEGQSLHLWFEPVAKGVVSLIDGFPCVNSMCRVYLGNQVGVGMAETSNNALGGTTRPFVFSAAGAVLENGLFRL